MPVLPAWPVRRFSGAGQAAKAINPGINVPFFGGIVAGIVAGHVYNRFHATSLPAYLAFFGGKRLVPIMTGLICLILAGISGVVWPAINLNY